MSMLTLNGQVMNVLEVPEGKKRDGTEYGGYHQVQLLCEEPLKNGEKRMNLFTLSCDNPEPFKKAQGRPVSVSVGAFARGSQIHFYLQKGTQVISDAPQVGK